MSAINLFRISIITTSYNMDSLRDIINDQLNYCLDPAR